MVLVTFTPPSPRPLLLHFRGLTLLAPWPEQAISGVGGKSCLGCTSVPQQLCAFCPHESLSAECLMWEKVSVRKLLVRQPESEKERVPVARVSSHPPAFPLWSPLLPAFSPPPLPPWVPETLSAHYSPCTRLEFPPPWLPTEEALEAETLWQLVGLWRPPGAGPVSLVKSSQGWAPWESSPGATRAPWFSQGSQT